MRAPKVKGPRRLKRDAKAYVEQATGRKVGWKAARKWLKRAARRG